MSKADDDRCLERAKEVLGASHAWRAAHEALCGVHMANTYGSGWAKRGTGQRGGAAVRRLKPRANMDTADIRVSLNKVREKVQEIESRIKPRLINLRVEPATNTRDDQIVAKVSRRRMDLYLADKIPLRHLRRAVEWMVVLGSVIVRRTIARKGPETRLYRLGDEGKPEVRRDENHRMMTIRDFTVRWQVSPPHEFCRDPALAHDVNFEGEDCIGHEKACTVDELYRTWGVKVKTEMTMGRLMGYNSLLHKWTHGAGGQQLSTEKNLRPAVMLSDWWFRDDRGPEWSKYMVAYRDTASETDPTLRPIHIGPNPYYSLPLHHLTYTVIPGCAWAMGIPARLHHHQIAYDVAFTMWMRAIMTLSGNQIIVNTDALVDKLEDVLDRRLDHVYRIRGNFDASKAISRMQTPQIDQNVMAVMQMAPQWFDDATLTSPVMRGQTSKRGEAGAAVTAKVEQAETPLATITDEAELVTDDLLMGTAVDVGRSERIGELKEMFGEELDPRELAIYRSAFKSKRKPIGGVFVTRDSIRPRHPRESRQELQEAIQAGMIDAQVARWAHGIRTGDWMDPSEGDAYRKQTQEIQAMLAGRAPSFATGQNHPLHMKVIDNFTEDPVWDLLTEEQRDRIQDHREEHYDVTQIRTMDMQGAEQQPIEEPADMGMSEIEPGAMGAAQQIPFPAQGAPSPALAGPGAMAPMPGAPAAGPAELMMAAM